MRDGLWARQLLRYAVCALNWLTLGFPVDPVDRCWLARCRNGLHAPLPTGVGDSFHLSNVFAKIPISTSPFNNIIFENQNDDYLINIPDQRVSQLRFWFTTIDHEAITLNDDFSFTLKIEVMEDDEKTMVEQNSGIGELLRLLVLQQHQQIRSSKK